MIMLSGGRAGTFHGGGAGRGGPLALDQHVGPAGGGADPVGHPPAAQQDALGHRCPGYFRPVPATPSTIWRWASRKTKTRGNEPRTASAICRALMMPTPSVTVPS